MFSSLNKYFVHQTSLDYSSARMATWHTLQKEIFPDETIVSLVNVNKALKKKKSSFLILTVTREKPARVLIHQVI
jgi:hypothetical protein